MKALNLLCLVVLTTLVFNNVFAQTGESCVQAVQAVLGTNHTPAISGSEYWYVFTMPADATNKKLVITSDADYPVFVTSNDCDNNVTYGLGSKELVLANLMPSQTVLIEWVNLEEEFSWILETKDLEDGDNCSHPDIAEIGENQLLARHAGDYWYKFTMPNVTGKRLVINSATTNGVFILIAPCQDNAANAIGVGSVSLRNINPNQEVYIKWNNYDKQDFTWTLTIDDGAPGETCITAIPAIEGSNQFPASSLPLEFWYKFTMPNSSEKKLVITSSVTSTVTIYYGACDNFSSSSYGLGNVIGTGSQSHGILPNEEVYIHWYSTSGGDFDWNLSVEDLIPGDMCALAIPASLGDNQLPALLKESYFWYSYQMPPESGKKLKITSNRDEFVLAYTNTCEDLNFQSYSLDGNLNLTGLHPGDHVYIVWWSSTGGDFSWNLSVEDERPGDSCGTPAIATLGSNVTPSAPYWFSYIVPNDKNITITSVGQTANDTYLKIYNACDGAELTSSDNFTDLQSQVTLNGLQPGSEIYIKWDNVNSAEGFTWNISIEKSDQTILFNTITDKTLGDSPFNLIATSSSGLPILFSTSADKVAITGNQISLIKAGSVKINADQPGDNFYNAAPFVENTFCVNPAKPTLSLLENSSGIVLSSNAIEGNQWFKEGVLIEGATGITLEVTKSGLYTVKSTVDQCASIVSDEESVVVTGDILSADAIKIYPNPVADELVIELAQDQFASVKVIDLLGRTSHHTEGVGQIRMKVSELPSGSYVVQIQSNNVLVARKLIKK